MHARARGLEERGDVVLVLGAHAEIPELDLAQGLEDAHDRIGIMGRP